MTAKLPPEVEAAIDEAERSVYRYRAIITRSPYEGQFKQALDSREEWKAAITAACEKAYAAGQAAPAYWMEHRPVAGVEHDPDNGKLHGMCRRCITPWPCEYSPEAQR